MVVTLVIAVTIALTALAVNIDYPALFGPRDSKDQRRIRATRGYRRRRMLNSLMLIEISNIRLIVPFYNSLIHMLLSLFCAGVMYMAFREKAGSLLAVFCMPVGYLVPSLVLRLAADTMEYRLKKYYANFLITYGQFYRHTNNLFEAFRLSKPYLIEPLKGYVDRMLYEYDTRIKPERCLRNLRCRIHNPEIKTFFRGLELVYRKGGDVDLLIEKTIQAMESIALSDGKAEAESVGMRVGMYMVMVANFALLSYMMSGPYWQQVAHSIWGISMFMVNVLCAAFVVSMILQQGNWKEVQEAFERLD